MAIEKPEQQGGGIAFDKADLRLSREELGEKYLPRLEAGEISEDDLRTYLKDLKIKKVSERLPEDTANIYVEMLSAGDLSRLDEIPPETHSWIAEELASDALRLLAHNLDKFEKIDKIGNRIAEALIAGGYGKELVEHLDRFEKLDYAYISIKLIMQGNGHLVAQHLDTFEDIDHESTAMRLIYTGQGKAVFDNIEKFEGIDKDEIQRRIMEERELAGKYARAREI